MNKLVKIAVGQIKVIPANPLANVTKMVEWITLAKDKGAKIIVFPELCISGYLIGDLWEQEAFIRDCVSFEKRIEEASDGIAIIFGNIYLQDGKVNEDGRVRKYNALRMVENRLWKKPVFKTLMPNYREFDDSRHFYDNGKRLTGEYIKSIKERGGENIISNALEYVSRSYESLVTSDGIKIGGLLCEDAWDTDYDIKPIDLLYKKCDMIINISCSPYTNGKNSKRNRLFSKQSKTHSIPMLYVNNVGVQNNGKTIYTFDGGSCFYDKLGRIEIFGEPFEEKLSIKEFDLESGFGTIAPELERFPDDIGMLYKSISYGTKQFMEMMGIDKVVIGASGGIDSALVAAIMSKILPKENIILVNMPSVYNSDTTKCAARKLAGNLRCRYIVHPIQNVCDITRTQIKALNNLGNYSISESGQICETGYKPDSPDLVDGDITSLMYDNIQARDRSSRILAAWASWFGGVFTCNGNKSELTVGYTTFYGDLGGFVAPIADLWKTQVYEMAKWFNENIDNVIPEESISVKPSAELNNDQNVDKGKGDPLIYDYHDKLFSAWVESWNRSTPEDILNWAFNGILEEKIGYQKQRGYIISKLFGGNSKFFIDDLERWWNCYQGLSVAKRIQAPPIIAVSRRSFGFDHREAQLTPYYTCKYFDLKKKLTSN